VIAFRNTDPRWPFLRSDATQKAARWHAEGDGPANYFADTPVGAWAEFLRHEEIKDAGDLGGVQRSLWAVEIPDAGYAVPALPEATLRGDRTTYRDCQIEAKRVRDAGHAAIKAPSAALLLGAASGWACRPDEVRAAARNGLVYVLFGQPGALVGWPAVESGQPPIRILPLVNHF